MRNSLLGGKKVISLFSSGIAVLAVFGLLIMSGCLLLHTQLAGILGARDPLTAKMLSDYIISFSVGIPFLLINGMMLIFFLQQ